MRLRVIDVETRTWLFVLHVVPSISRAEMTMLDLAPVPTL